MRKTFYGWWVTLAAFLTFGIAVGLPYYNMPFFYDYFQREFHWTKGQITFGFPLAALLTLWIGPVLVPRFSPRKLILVGTALTCASARCTARYGSTTDCGSSTRWATSSPGRFRTNSSSRTGSGAIAARRWGFCTWAWA
jgi:nitrate/nitrite transporter NarK